MDGQATVELKRFLAQRVADAPVGIVHHPLTPDMEAWTSDERTPIVYHEPTNTLHVGEPEMLHMDVIKSMMQKGYHAPVSRNYAHGWLGDNPEAHMEGPDSVINENTPREFGWYEGGPGPHVDEAVERYFNAHKVEPNGGWDFTSRTADSWDTRQYPDQASDPLPATHYDHEKDCTCKEGHKLDCPVHGLNADIDQSEKPWSWSVPEASPVGYPQDQPRAWQTPYTGKVARETLPQQQRKWQALDPHSPVLHRWPNGWNVQLHTNSPAITAVGTMMRNCWQAGYPTGTGECLAIHDPDGIPRVAFERKNGEMKNALGVRNADPHPEHLSLIADYAHKSGQTWVPPDQEWERYNQMGKEMEQPFREEEDDMEDVAPPVLGSWKLAASPDELFVALNVPKKTADEIHEWAKEQDWPKGTELEEPEEYHITLLYSKEGHKKHKDAEWWVTDNSDGIKVKAVEEFPSQERGDQAAFVLRLDTASDEIKTRMENLLDEAEKQGVDVNRFPGGSKPHITVAFGPKLPEGLKPPDITFSSDEAHCGSPRTSKMAAQHWGEWNPGHPGKWAKDKEGGVALWKVFGDGWPHHYDMMDPSQIVTCGAISPAGVVTGDDPDHSPTDLEEVARQHPALSAPDADFGYEFFSAVSEDPNENQNGKQKVHTNTIPDGPWKVNYSGMPAFAEMVPVEALEPYMEFQRAPGAGEAEANPEYWELLKNHIAQNGFEDPITLEYNPGRGTAKIGEGNHRIGIAKELGLTHVPVSGMRTQGERNMRPLHTAPRIQPDETGYFPGCFKPSDLGLPVSEDPYTEPEAHTWQDATKPYYDKFKQGAINQNQMPLGWPWAVNTQVEDNLLGKRGVVRDIDEPGMKAFVQWEGPSLGGTWTNATSLQPKLAWEMPGIQPLVPRAHYNRWTGKLCHCPFGSIRQPRMARMAGKKLENLMGRPDLQNPEGQQFLSVLQKQYPEQEDLYHYFTNRWKKGDMRVQQPVPAPSWQEPTEPTLQWWQNSIPQAEVAQKYKQRLMDSDRTFNPAITPEEAEQRWQEYEKGLWTRLHPHVVNQWHEWFQAKRHPTRRGIDVMAPDFTPYQMADAAGAHQESLREERELQEAMQHGKTEMVFPKDPGGIDEGIDWDTAKQQEQQKWLDKHDGANPPNYLEAPSKYLESLQMRQKFHPQLINPMAQLKLDKLKQLYPRVSKPRKAGWHVKHLTSYLNDQDQENNIEDALAGEGSLMNHCIGSDEQPYQELAQQGLISAYSLRDEKGKPHATWAYNSDGSLAEMYGHSDASVIPEYKKLIDQWGDEHGHETGHQSGLNESVADNEINLPGATDMSEYIANHHPDYIFETAEFNAERGYDPEHTELNIDYPALAEIADEFYQDYGPEIGNGPGNFIDALQHGGHEYEFQSYLDDLQMEKEREEQEEQEYQEEIEKEEEEAREAEDTEGTHSSWQTV